MIIYAIMFLLSTYLHTTYTGNFYGLCIELCGSGHSHMPVTIRVIKE